MQPIPVRSPARQIDSLTGLRFVAAAGVLFCHYAAALGVPDGWLFVAEFGGSFVALFFVLSGYVLAYQYDGRLSDTSARKSYFVARIARVAPVYWLCLFGTLILFLFAGFDLSLGGSMPDDDRGWTFILNAMALQPWIPHIGVQQYWNAPGWSIGSEVFFYACLPWLLRLCWLDGSIQKLFILWGVAGVLLSGICTAIIWSPAFSESERQLAFMYLIRCPLIGLFCFVLGIHLSRAPVTRASAELTAIAVLGVSLSLSLAAWLNALQSDPRWFFPGLLLSYYLVYTPTFFAVIRACCAEAGWVARLLARPFMVALGHASYSLYLIHWIPLMWIMRDNAQGQSWSGVEVGIAVGVQIIASWILFFVFENPVRQWIRQRFGCGEGTQVRVGTSANHRP